MLRLFVGLEFPGSIQNRLATLAGGVPGARWTPMENLHLTLRFIGEVDARTGGDIDLALTRIDAPPFTLVLDGVGQFGTGGRSRLIWAGVERNESLNFLQAKVESALVRAGVAVEDRKFAPHVTLARLKDAPAHRVGQFLQERALFRTDPIPIDRFVLFRSHQGRGGAHYEPVRRYVLGSAWSGLADEQNEGPWEIADNGEGDPDTPAFPP